MQHTEPMEHIERENNSMASKPVVSFNKKKYVMLETALNTLSKSSGLISQEQINSVLKTIKTVLKFDPTLPTYTKEDIERNTQYKKQKAAALNTSMYEITNKKYYTKYRNNKRNKSQLCEAPA